MPFALVSACVRCLEKHVKASTKLRVSPDRSFCLPECRPLPFGFACRKRCAGRSGSCTLPFFVLECGGDRVQAGLHRSTLRRLFSDSPANPKKSRRRPGNFQVATYLTATIETATAKATRTSLADVPRWCLGARFAVGAMPGSQTQLT